MDTFLKGWKSGAAAVQSVFRKYEYDWTKVSTCILDNLYSMTSRHGGLMVSMLDSRSSSTGLSSGRGHCVVFLVKTLHSHGASLKPHLQMGACK